MLARLTCVAERINIEALFGAIQIGLAYLRSSSVICGTNFLLQSAEP